jgi:GDP-4-dehydro-6-deoxy-D-mannose reductase
VSVGSAAEYAPSGREVVSESCAVVGPSAYGRSKWAQGAVALSLGGQLGIEVIVLRTFNLIGPGLSSRFVAGWLCAQFAGADYTGVLKAGNLHSARDFVDVRDAVNAYWLAAREGKAGQAYNVCSGKATTVEELIGLLSEITGLRPRVEVDPERVRGATDVGVWGTFDKLRLATGWYPRIGLRRSLEDMLAELPGHDRC